MSGSRARYVRTISPPREDVLDGILRDSLLAGGLRPMQVDDNAARVLHLLTALTRPRLALEIGTYFGYSAIHIARGLPPDGRLVTLEIDQEVAALARKNLERAGLAERVDVVVGPAAEYLAGVAPESVDLVFIDADKLSYPTYLKLCFPLLRPGGVLIADDAFADGDLSGESEDSEGADAVRAINSYNRAVAHSARLLSAFVGTNNGFMVSYKR